MRICGTVCMIRPRVGKRGVENGQLSTSGWYSASATYLEAEGRCVSLIEISPTSWLLELLNPAGLGPRFQVSSPVPLYSFITQEQGAKGQEPWDSDNREHFAQVP